MCFIVLFTECLHVVLGTSFQAYMQRSSSLKSALFTKKKIYIYLELKDDLGDFLMVLLQMIYSCAVGLKLMLSLTGNVLILLNSFPSERT